MKILLITDMPPCKNFTAGLVLAQLVSFLPKDSIVCYSVLHPDLHPDLDENLSWMPLRIVKRPRETAFSLLPGKLGIFTSFIMELYHEWIKVPKILKDIKSFVQEFNPDRIWCVLEGQTTFRLAVKVSKALNLPLHTEIWDPPGWWLRANKVDFLSEKLIMRSFNEAMRRSKTTAAASWAMAEEYNERYACNAIPVIPSLDAKLAKKPAIQINEGDTFTIGMAGQLYSHTEWWHLLTTLYHVNWQIGGKKIVIRMFGRSIGVEGHCAQHIDFLGWRPQEEVIQSLSEVDALYCPYWFDKNFEEEARYSFPSKLTTYLCAGRPVFFHGPDYASPARFLKQHNAGIFCHDLYIANIYHCIDRLIWDKKLYRELSENGHRAFMDHLTTDVMKQQFINFLDIKTSVISDTIMTRVKKKSFALNKINQSEKELECSMLN